ncbi:MAG TPA: RNA 3'-terminal phosphate cyclase [Euryarchaeota archaeon]|nr:RNA 3'-terminal phosphate cyclase [archaeon BMS3Bbin15]HDL14990.1 RNA 3'-terminal phosphate cyclase [Euryarchaeota archaeon]
MLRIDGSQGEGGGQIFRTSLALSALLQEPIEIFNIRVKRPKPGLAMQHLTTILAFRKIFSGEVKGAKPGSTRVIFTPSKIKEGEYSIDIGTAGSITLLLQALLPATIYHNITLKIKGGTDVRWSPACDYFSQVLLKNLNYLGVKADMELIARGYYPKGNGKVKVEISGVDLIEGYEFKERGKLIGIRGRAHCSNLPEHIVKREAKAVEEVLPHIKAEIDIEVRKELSTGTGITLWADYQKCSLGSSVIGEIGKSAEKVGREAAMKLIEEINSPATLDVYMADQIIPFAALARGRTSFLVRRLTGHLLTNIELTEKILGVKFDKKELDNHYIISVEGTGWKL